MTTNLGLVAHAAERHPDVIATDGMRDRAAEAGLANPWRADEADNRGTEAVTGQLADGDVLDDPLLDLLQPVVICLQDFGGLVEIEPVLRLNRPWQLRQPLEVGTDHADLWRERVLLLQSLHLDQRLRLDLFRHAGGLDLLAQLAGQALFGTPLAKLLLNGTHLLPEEVLALLLVHPGLGLGLDLLPQIEHIEALLDDHAEPAQPLDRIKQLQELLALLGGKLRRERNQVGEPARLVDTADHRQDLFRHVWQHRDVALNLLQHRRHGRLSLGRGVHRIIPPGDTSDYVGLLLDDLLDHSAGQSLENDVGVPPRAGDALAHFGDHADGAKLILLGLLLIRRPALRGSPWGIGGVHRPVRAFVVQIRQRVRQGIGDQLAELAVRLDPVSHRPGRTIIALWQCRHRTLGQHKHMTGRETGGPIQDHRRLLVLDGEGDRHVGQEQRFLDYQHWQRHRSAFGHLWAHRSAAGPWLGHSRLRCLL